MLAPHWLTRVILASHWSIFRSGEHEGVRRIKTEFLLQFEGMTTGSGERIVVVAATNRPQVRFLIIVPVCSF